MKVDVQIEFRRRSDFSEGFQADICRTPPTKCKNNFVAAWPSITDIGNRFIDFGLRITERTQNSPPVWIAPGPARPDQRTVRNRSRGQLGVAGIPRAEHFQPDHTRSAFAVADDHFRQLETNEI